MEKWEKKFFLWTHPKNKHVWQNLQIRKTERRFFSTIFFENFYVATCKIIWKKKIRDFHKFSLFKLHPEKSLKMEKSKRFCLLKFLSLFFCYFWKSLFHSNRNLENVETLTSNWQIFSILLLTRRWVNH